MLRKSASLFVAFFLLAAALPHPSAGQTDFTTYRSEEYGYSIEYPETHQVGRREYPTQKFPDQERVRFEGPKAAYMVVASRSERLGRVTDEEFLTMMKQNQKALRQSLKQSPRHAVKLQGISTVKVSGRQALFIEGEEIERDFVALMVYFKEEKTMYQVIARTSPSTWNTDRESIMRVLMSLEVEQ